MTESSAGQAFERVSGDGRGAGRMQRVRAWRREEDEEPGGQAEAGRGGREGSMDARASALALVLGSADGAAGLGGRRSGGVLLVRIVRGDPDGVREVTVMSVRDGGGRMPVAVCVALLVAMRRPGSQHRDETDGGEESRHGLAVARARRARQGRCRDGSVKSRPAARWWALR